MGGRSRERSVSIASGKACCDAIKKIGYKVFKYDPIKNIKNNIKKIIQTLYLIVYTENTEKMVKFKKF